MSLSRATRAKKHHAVTFRDAVGAFSSVEHTAIYAAMQGDTLEGTTEFIHQPHRATHLQIDTQAWHISL